MHIHCPYLTPEPENLSPRIIPFRPRRTTLNIPYHDVYPSDETDKTDFVHIPSQQEPQQPSPAELPGNTPLDAPPPPSTPPLFPTQTAAWLASDDGATVTYMHNTHHHTIPADVYLDCGETACSFVLGKIHEKEVLENRLRGLECAHEELVREADEARWRLRRLVLGIRVLMRLEGLSLGDRDEDGNEDGW